MLTSTKKSNQIANSLQLASWIKIIRTGFFLIAANMMLTGFGQAQARWSNDFSDSQAWNAVQYGSTIMFGDLRNTGRQDMCGRGAAGIYCVLSNSAQFGAPILATTDFSDATPFVNQLYYSSLRMGDVNGDHRADICGWRADGIYCALGNGDGTFAHATRWTYQYSASDGWSANEYTSTLMLGDLNQDGVDDICMRSGNGLYCSLSNKSGFLPSRQAGSEFSNNLGWSDPIYYSSLRLGDINGDGKADVCGRGFAGIICTLGKGDGTFGGSELWSSDYSNGWGWGQMAYASTIMLGDVDGDGKADVCGRGIAGVYCSMSSGTSFGPMGQAVSLFADTSAIGSFTLPAYYGSIRLADVTGDHMADLCGRGERGLYCMTASLTFSDVIY